MDESHSEFLLRMKAIRFGKLIDGRGQVWRDTVIFVEGGFIQRLTIHGEAIPLGEDVIDLSRFTAIPGLIDVHTHMTYYWDQKPGTNPWIQLQMREPEETLRLAEENARRTLETGVTTVRNLYASHYTDISMRELIGSGRMAGPRMFVSGHGLFAAESPSVPGAIVVTSRNLRDRIVDIQRAVQQQIKAGADWIKMFASMGSADDVSGDQTFSYEEIEAAAEAAHSEGKRIAVHSYGPDAARDAVRAGVDSIEHATGLDDETIAQMVERRIYYVPTIDHNRYYAEYKDHYGYDHRIVNSLNHYLRRNVETARKAWKAKARFAMGSDAVFTMFGQNTRELEWFVRIGMTPEQALATATTNAAALLGMERNLAALAPGYLADIVAVEGDPLADINVAIHKVKWVMKDGSVVVDKTHGSQ